MSRFGDALLKMAQWFASNQRVMPWRSDTPSAYSVWISEVMLQQTQVKTAIPYFERFLARFPDIRSLADASPDEVFAYWSGLGYYARARNLHKAAQIIARSGAFPDDYESLIALPGIGSYTAGAILSIAFHRPVAILDANVRRLLSRIRAIASSSDKHLTRISKCFVESAYRLSIDPSVCNQSLMELGALVCTPTAPDCARCPLKSICKAFRSGAPESFPVKKPRTKPVDISEQAYAYTNRRCLLYLVRREKQEWLSGLWELPTIPLETLIDAPEIGRFTVSYTVTHHRIERQVAIFDAGDAAFPDSGRTISLDSDAPEAVGSAMQKCLTKIKASVAEYRKRKPSI